MAKDYKINVQGYYREEVRMQFPQVSAIYFIYKGSYDAENKTCSLKQLLFIGESDNLYEANNEHRLRGIMADEMNENEVLFYTLAFVDYSEGERKLITDALIYELRPKLNIQENEPTRPLPISIVVEGNRHAFVPARLEAPSF